jgi:hypothetical protein
MSLKPEMAKGTRKIPDLACPSSLRFHFRQWALGFFSPIHGAFRAAVQARR